MEVSPQMVESLNRILSAALSQGQNRAFARLSELCDRFGCRLSGSEALERAIDWCLEGLRADGLEGVRGEECHVPRWVRGNESATLIQPRRQALGMLGIGSSVGTPPEGVQAEVIVVSDADECKRAEQDGRARGHIVLFNKKFTRYGESVEFRLHGATRAAQMGAVAALVRSVCPASLHTPHTGTLVAPSAADKIVPAACITTEDADLLQRLCAAGSKPVVQLQMEAKTLPDVLSRNVVAELRGRETPEEIVVVGGHIDSWDVGQGAHDDAQGCIAAWEAVRLIASLGLRPRRTVRVVMWTNEENGHRGADAYLANHRHEVHDHVAAIESDMGCFRAVGFGLSAGGATKAALGGLLKHLGQVGADRVFDDGRGVDISPLIDAGVPGLLLRLDDEWWERDYFRLHHTAADTVDKVDPAHLRQNVAALAGLVYLLAECPQRLPRE
jgi:carboxypeptidase Q